MIIQGLQCTKVQADGQFSGRDQIQAEMTIAYADQPQSQFKYVGIIGGPLQLVAEPIQTQRSQRQPASIPVPAPIHVPLANPSLPPPPPPPLPVSGGANHRPENVSVDQTQHQMLLAESLPNQEVTRQAPAPPVTTRRFTLILQIIFIACYAVILIMQIACLGSPNWTKKGTSTLGGLAESSYVILKIVGLVMILLGVLSLLCNVALIALGVWIIFRKVYHKYSIIKKLLPLSVFPWTIAVKAIVIVLAIFGDFGATTSFSIVVAVLLIGAAIYTSWASNRIIE